MSTYTNFDWLTQLAADIASMIAGTMTPTAFVTAMQGYTDGWIGIASSDMVLAQKVSDTVAAFVTRDTNFDNWINGTVTGGYNSDGTPSDGVAPHGGYYPLTTLAGSTLYFACPAKLVSGLVQGDPGGVGFTFSTTTTDADPGNGNFRLNNATPASVTQIFFDNLEAGGSDVSAWLDTFDDNGSSVRGQLTLREAGTSKFMVFNVTGAVVNGSGYRKVPVSFISGSALFSNGFKVDAIFASIGVGDVTGPTGATDGHAAVFNGATGKAVKSAGFAPENAGMKGLANGYAGLDSGGKVPTTQLPSAVLGGLNYQGTWNASTNTPTIPAAASGNKGWFYKVSVAGTTTIDGISDWQVGDWIVSNGSTWDKVDNTDQVLSVAGLQGTISSGSLRVALSIDHVDNTSDLNKPISTATQTALNDLSIDYMAAVAMIMNLTELEVPDAARVIGPSDSGKLLFFTSSASRVIAYADALPAGFYCALMMASTTPVELQPGVSDVKAVGGLTEVSTPWKFAVLRRLSSSLVVLDGGDATPATSLNRTEFNRAGASALLNPVVI